MNGWEGGREGGGKEGRGGGRGGEGVITHMFYMVLIVLLIKLHMLWILQHIKKKYNFLTNTLPEVWIEKFMA